MKIKNILFGFLGGVVALTTVNTARTQISYDGTALSYSQNFDSLGTSSHAWTDNSTLSGWYLNSTTLGIPATLTANNGSASGATVAYNVGINGVNPLTDRALAWKTISTTGDGYIGVQLQNNSGQDYVGGVAFNWVYEQWSSTNNGISDPLIVAYKANVVATGNQLLSSGWTQLNSIASPYLSAVTGVQNGAIDGNASANRVADAETVTFTAGSPWLAGSYLWFSTDDKVITTGNGKNDMNAIDDVSINIQAVPEPAAWTLLAMGILGMVTLMRRVGKMEKSGDAQNQINVQ